MRDLGISRVVFLITMNTCLECPHVIVTAPIPATAKWGGWALTPTVSSYAEASEDVDFPSLELRRANYGESYFVKVI
jgi:hypothetical protein